MSRQNKVNKSNYDQGGRLTPDDMARERMNQGRFSGRAKQKEAAVGKAKAPERRDEQASSRPRSEREE
jgi:hypothetical protein